MGADIIVDQELGNIIFNKNVRARAITARVKDGKLYISYPSHLKRSYVLTALETLRPRLRDMISKAPKKIVFAPDIHFSTLSFTLEISQNSLSNYYSRLKNGILYITYPLGVNYEDEDAQNIFRSIIEKSMRIEANRIFPTKIKAFADKCGFEVSGVKINKSCTRWGSCSSRKSINLSLYCMLLPEYLADFVILHELCHTVEMNHGDQFWALLDKVSSGKAKALTKELKQYKINW